MLIKSWTTLIENIRCMYASGLPVFFPLVCRGGATWNRLLLVFLLALPCGCVSLVDGWIVWCESLLCRGRVGSVRRGKQRWNTEFGAFRCEADTLTATSWLYSSEHFYRTASWAHLWVSFIQIVVHKYTSLPPKILFCKKCANLTTSLVSLSS